MMAAGFTVKPADELLKKRGLQPGGAVQKYIDNECIRRMDKYTPVQSGSLTRSVISGTTVGTGILRYSRSYARAAYYSNAGRGRQGTANGGLRGPKWFERMKAACLKAILDGARKISGARRR